MAPMTGDDVWQEIRKEAQAMVEEEPALAGYYYAAILKHSTLVQAISFELANKLNSAAVPPMLLRELIENTMAEKPELYEALVKDICAHVERDPACQKYSSPLLHLKGFHALQAHRVSHQLWLQGRQCLAFYLQSQISQQLGVDIHPGAKVGSGIMLDHATGIVIGETAVLGNNISMLHSVTLGGIGATAGDRHPKGWGWRVAERGGKTSGQHHHWRRGARCGGRRCAGGCATLQHSGGCAGQGGRTKGQGSSGFVHGPLLGKDERRLRGLQPDRSNRHHR